MGTSATLTGATLTGNPDHGIPWIQLILGKTGCGKTSICPRLVAEAKQRLPNHSVVVVNTQLDKRLVSTLTTLPSDLNTIKKTIVVIDEIGLHQSAHWIPENLREFIVRIRYNDNRLIAISQRVVDHHNLLWTNVSRVYAFRVQAIAQINALRQYADAKTIEIIRKLRPGEFVTFAP